MTLAKRHIQRLWFPAPGHGGAIASRAENAITTDEFNRRIPNEFWREVVDRCAAEAPHTLLLAEAFWMMEGYFVRTLGMHRVYNSAFMNMLKNEENEKYRSTIKNTLEFDPEVLKRFVNFMNNPDEETAVAQFGKGDKYFGICTLLVTMPGLPMFGHGQIEGFEEKYGMEYRRSYRDETPDWNLVNRHEWEIFPLMKKRHIFSGSANFCLYDFFDPNGYVNENVFAYSNSEGEERALIFYNNCYYQTSGWIRRGAVAIPQKDGTFRQDFLHEAFGLHGENRFFTIIREQRSNLWYVRSSKDIAERGLFAALNGYETQVFLDIQEKEDVPDAQPGSWKTRWATLNYELNGRGVRNIDETLLDIFLKEIYSPVREILSPDCMEKLSHFFSTPKKSIVPSIHDFIESFREPIKNFEAAAKKYLDGADGKFEPWGKSGLTSGGLKSSGLKSSGLKSGEKKSGGKTKRKVNSSKDTFSEWSMFFENLLALNKNQTGKENKFARGLKKKITGQPSLLLMALGYNTLTLLRPILNGFDGVGDNSGKAAASLALHWQLDRILAECWESAGVPSAEARRAAEIAVALLARTGSSIPESYRTAKPPSAIAAALILENYNEGDFRKILAVNRFEGVTWFNKEAFEEALFLVSFFLYLETPGTYGKESESSVARQERAETIAEAVEALSKAKEASAYKLEELLGALAEK
jgi:hypothetical protein